MNVQELQPGRKLDALVAEKVMGYRLDPTRTMYAVLVGWETYAPANVDWEKIRPYSTSDEAALEVVRRMWWRYGAHWEEELAETSPIGICRAALHAVTEIPRFLELLSVMETGR